MTPEEREARAEQLVEAMRVERKRHTLIGWNACTCHDDSWRPPYPMHGDQDERVLAWERHVESAVLNVVRTERSAEKCDACEGTGIDPDTKDSDVFRYYGAVEPGSIPPCQPCEGSGSAPGELLVVGLIGALTEEYNHAVEAWEYAAERADERDEAVGLLRGIVERHDRSDYPMDLTDEVKGARSFLARIIEKGGEG